MDGHSNREELDTGLASLALVSKLLGVPADAAQLRHSLGIAGRESDSADIIRAARLLGFKARRIRSDWSRLGNTHLPAIAAERHERFFVLARVDGDRALVQDPQEDGPVILSRPDFEADWNGSLILVTRRDGPSSRSAAFGFTWFVPAILKYRLLLGEVLAASFFIQLFALFTPLFFQVVIDKVLVHRGLTTLDVLAVGLLAVHVFDVLLGGLRNYVFAHTGNRIDVALGTELFRHLLRLPLGYFESRRVGDTVARVRELESIRNFLTGSSVTLLIDVAFALIFFAVMYLYSPALTLIVLGTLPAYALLALVVTPLLRARLQEKFSRGADNHAFLVESLHAIRTLKAAAVEPLVQRRWEEQLAAYVAAAFKAVNLGNIAGQLASFINRIMTLLILWLGARLVIGGQLSVGQLVAFNMLAGRVSGPILRCIHLWQDFQQAGVSVRRLADILDAQPEPAHLPGRAALPRPRSRVTLDDVTFRYRPDGPDVLRRLSLEVGAGEVVGVVGRSGSGKSTLAKLIQRLYVPQAGRVLLDGVDLAMVDAFWLRRHVGVVLQDSVLFNRSVRENIALSDPAMSMERIVRAAALACAHEFILALPEGYDTVVGERGDILSGGQRQRIAIARALTADPRILILDEATSALDYESEHLVQENMRRICRGRTVFIIAHRLSALRVAERIVVLERGAVTEAGTHRELRQQGGYYARLFRHQLAMAAGDDAVRVVGGDGPA